ncbi:MULTISPECIES: mitofilin family membrane protein [unclassified Thalassospira]|uniref:COG4223 family protein n=1 Tax=unclassified Thalassospira TaxID=2648997 RepID=UPI001B17A8C4|nr:mitofilin family membrane protein [Thalassospira sp.]MBO6770210.1 uroporphyrinogen III synthase [Thalassospira sp.]
MKTPETPKTNASAKSTDTEKPTETISVDSKGNASPDPKKADATHASKPGTSDNSAKKPDSSPKAENPAKADATKPGSTSTGAKQQDEKPASTAARKGAGGKAIVIFVLIIVGGLAAGWLTRAIWWRDAQPHLAQFVPNDILAEIAPDGFDADNPQSGEITVTNGPEAAGGSEENTIPAPSEDAAMAEKDDAEVKTEEESRPTVTGMDSETADAAPIPDGAVVVDPDLTERLSRLEGTINALRERLNSERGDTLNNTVARRMAEIETRTAPIEELARVESELAGVANEMRELSARLSTMEEEVRATTGLRVESRGQAIAMAVTILRDALQRGGPFMIALNQLERSAGDDAVILDQIETLKPLAEQGAPTIEKLRQSFPIMAQEAVAAATDDHSGSVLDATWANIKKLVPIRRVDAAGEESLEGRLVLAENALAQDDLDGAVAALNGVEGEHAQAAVSDWLDAAKRRQTLNASIATLSAHAIGLLTGAEDSQ